MKKTRSRLKGLGESGRIRQLSKSPIQSTLTHLLCVRGGMGERGLGRVLIRGFPSIHNKLERFWHTYRNTLTQTHSQSNAHIHKLHTALPKNQETISLVKVSAKSPSPIGARRMAYVPQLLQPGGEVVRRRGEGGQVPVANRDSERREETSFTPWRLARQAAWPSAMCLL